MGVSVRGGTGEDGVRELLLKVTDTGPGVSADDTGSIFRRGWSTKQDSGGDRGRGLGLALVRQTVQRHGGTVDVGSAPDGGAEFAVRLPLREET